MHIQYFSSYTDDVFGYNHCAKRHLSGLQLQEHYEPHYHTQYEILFIKEGDISYEIDGETYPLPPNSLVFTRPNQIHRLKATTTCIYNRYDLFFDPVMLSADFLSQIPEDVHVLAFDSNPIVIQLFDRMDYYNQKLSGSSLQVMLYRLLDELFTNILLLVQPGDGSVKANIRPLTQLALNYVDEYLLSPNLCESLCSELGICRSYLHRLFSEDLNTTPKRYIMKRRLSLAQLEIYDGAKSTAIFEKYGFADYSSFFRAYKKQFGCPPSDTPQSAFTKYSNQRKQ